MKKIKLLIALFSIGLLAFSQPDPNKLWQAIISDPNASGYILKDLAVKDTLWFGDWSYLTKAPVSYAERVDSIWFNDSIPDQYPRDYKLYADSLTGLLAYFKKNATGEDYINATLSFPFINTLSDTIRKGWPLSSKGIDFSKGRGLPTVEITVCNDLDLSQTFSGICKSDVPPNGVGEILNQNFLIGFNTTGFNLNDVIYVDCDTSLTNIQPDNPNYKIIVGKVLYVGVNGIIAVTAQPFTGSDTDIGMQGFLNGIITELQGIRDTIISGSLYFETYNENHPTKDLPFMYNKNRYLLNTTSNTGTNGYARVQLTAGTTSNAQENYIYIDNSGVPTLTSNTIGFPEDAIELAYCGVWDISTHSTNSFAWFQRFNNQPDGSNSKGLAFRTVKRIRLDGSKYESGIDPTVTIVTMPTIDSLQVSTTSGLASQFNQQTFSAQDGREYVWFNSPNGDSIIYDLNQISYCEDGVTSLRANNDMYGLNIFGIVNSVGIIDKLGVTTPSGKYSSEENCKNDIYNYAVTNPPGKYSYTTIRLYRIVVKYITASGGTFTNLEGSGGFQEERGFPLGTSGSGSGGTAATNNHSDALFNWFNSTDPTKKTTVDLNGITTGSIIDLQIPDTSGTIALKEYSLQSDVNVNRTTDSIYFKKGETEKLKSDTLKIGDFIHIFDTDTLKFQKYNGTIWETYLKLY